MVVWDSSTIPLDMAAANGISDHAAIRFLEQSAFGAPEEEVRRVKELGFDQYINEQFAIPPSEYVVPNSTGSVAMNELKQQFIRNALFGKDQLRQRLAFALSQIFVISTIDVNYVDAIASYQRMLLRYAFTTYSRLLLQVTLHPAMGHYLNMANNFAGPHPNENYAREVMQLFLTGTVLLNTDGTVKTDALGEPIAVYTQGDVEELSRALTGWTYPTPAGRTRGGVNPVNFRANMEPVDSLHDRGEKLFLGQTLPAGQGADADLTAALKIVASHPNVAPFIAYRLIQHFVTSNPSPQYVQRVAEVFNRDGTGMRGNMKAVIKAILLDEEARRGDDPADAAVEGGKLKEPVVFVTQLLRSLNASGTMDEIWRQPAFMGQHPFSPPSVFGFYSPGYVVPTTDRVGPEFQIYNSPEILARINFVDTVIFGRSPSIKVDMNPWKSMTNDVPKLIRVIERKLLHGSMNEYTRTVITQAVGRIPATDSLLRAQTALYLVATAPEYFVHH